MYSRTNSQHSAPSHAPIDTSESELVLLAQGVDSLNKKHFLPSKINYLSTFEILVCFSAKFKAYVSSSDVIDG